MQRGITGVYLDLWDPVFTEYRNGLLVLLSTNVILKCSTLLTMDLFHLNSNTFLRYETFDPSHS
jgi:hypothetical protein